MARRRRVVATLRKLGRALGVTALPVLLVLAAVPAPEPARGAEPVKIGLHAPLTGFAAADGQSVYQSVQIAVDQVNRAGGLLGRPVELVVYDDRADAREGVAVAQRLIERDRVVAVVGGSYSAPMRATAPLYQTARIPMVVGFAVHPDITRAGEFVYRIGFLGQVEGAGAAEAAATLLGARRVVMFTMDNDFGRALAGGFKARAAVRGLQIMEEFVYPLGEQNFSSYLVRTRQLNPDLIFASGYYNEAAQLVRQARQLGVTATILGEEGFDTPKFLEIAGPAAEGVYIVTNLDRDDPRPVVQQFIAEYRARFKMEPDMVGASNYDAFMVLADAIRRAGSTDPEAIRRALAATREFEGLTGRLTFTPGRETIKPVQVQVVKDGAFRSAGVITDPAVITPPW